MAAPFRGLELLAAGFNPGRTERKGLDVVDKVLIAPMTLAGIDGEFNVSCGRAWNFTEFGARDRARIIEITALNGGHPFAANEVDVAVPDENLLGNRF